MILSYYRHIHAEPSYFLITRGLVQEISALAGRAQAGIHPFVVREFWGDV